MCRNVQSNSYLCSSNCAFVQLRLTAVRCYAPDPAREAISAPSDLLAGFWERKGRERKRQRGKKGNGSERENEVRKGQGEVSMKGKGRILCSCDFSWGKTAREGCAEADRIK